MCSQACVLKWQNYVAITLEETVLMLLTSTVAQSNWVGLCWNNSLLKRGKFLGIIITNLQKAMCVRVEKFPVPIIWFRNEYWFRTQKTCMFPTWSCRGEAYQIIMGRWLNLMKSRGARGFPGGATSKTNKQTNKNPLANAGDIRDSGWILGSEERSPEGGHGNPLQYSCLEIPWTEEPGGLPSMGGKESDTTEAT